MPNARLLACPACARHVRVSESSCPFCSGPLPTSFGEAPLPSPPRSRLSRAALAAFSASSLAIASVSCGGTVEGVDGGDQDSSVGPDDGQAADGGAPDATPDSPALDARRDCDHLSTALYGGPWECP
jgi:hypothetical protein